MQPLKKKIETLFSNAAYSYDSVASVQKYCADVLIDKIRDYQKHTPQRILELGAGTAYCSKRLMSLYPDSSYVLNDISPKMIEYCKSMFDHHAHIFYSIGDMELLEFEECDLIISNLALQWVDNLKTVLGKFHNKTNVFAFSTLLKGTFQEWEDLIKNYENLGSLRCYPEEKELMLYCHTLKKQGEFYSWIEDIHLNFETPLAFMLYLKHLGAGASDHKVSLQTLKSIIKNHSKEFMITYKIFFGLFTR